MSVTAKTATPTPIRMCRSISVGMRAKPTTALGDDCVVTEATKSCVALRCRPAQRLRRFTSMTVAGLIRRHPVRSAAILLTATLLCFSIAGAARQIQAPGRFRAGVDLIQLDVSVLDKDRHPVRGLAAGDFTVLVDGQPRPIVAFKAVELAPPPPPPSASWMREVAPDVVANTDSPG